MPFRRNARHFANNRGEGMDHECLSLRALPLRKIELTSGNIILLILCVLAFYSIPNEVFLFLFLVLFFSGGAGAFRVLVIRCLGFFMRSGFK